MMSAVIRLARALDIDAHPHDSTQGIRDARQPDLDVLRVADHDHVGLDALLLLLEEPCQVLRADLLLALDEHLDVYGQAAARLEPGADGAEQIGRAHV